MNLNLGCGLEPIAGYVNVDRRALPGVAVVWNLDDRPWPFEDRSATEIRAFDVFEHVLDVIGCVDECWRILGPGGRLTVRGPTPESENLWVDVSHRRAFVAHSFDHFDWTTEFGKKYRYGVGPWRVAQVRREDSNILFDLIRLE